MPQRRHAIFLNEQEKNAEFLRLLRAGKSYREIEEETGWSRTEVCDAVKPIMAQLWATIADDLSAYVVQEVQRCEMMWERLRPRLERVDDNNVPDPDLKAMEIALKLSKRKSELLGLDRQAKGDEKSNDGLQRALSVEEIQQRLGAVFARVLTTPAPLPVYDALPPGTVTIEEADE